MCKLCWFNYRLVTDFITWILFFPRAWHWEWRRRFSSFPWNNAKYDLKKKKSSRIKDKLGGRECALQLVCVFCQNARGGSKRVSLAWVFFLTRYFHVYANLLLFSVFQEWLWKFAIGHRMITNCLLAPKHEVLIKALMRRHKAARCSTLLCLSVCARRSVWTKAVSIRN